jgi:hypothetical protein
MRRFSLTDGGRIVICQGYQLTVAVPLGAVVSTAIGDFMLRLTALLCATIYVTLLLAGEDKGQMRPGLAKAVAAGEEIVVLRREFSPAIPLPARDVPPAATPEPPAQVVSAAYVPAAPAPPAVAPAVRKATPQPVFSLSTLPGVTGDVADPSPDMASDAPPAPAASADERQIWYVAARSVNVRQGPSTETAVVGRLQGGEAVTVVAMEGSDWAHILIEGDGLDGYVATRLLSPTP